MPSTLDDPDDDPRPSTAAADPCEEGPNPATPTPPLTSPTSAVVTEFTAFYRDATPRLVAFLRWQGASLPDAADCVQETLARAFQQWATLREPYGWCRVVASRRYARLIATIREHPTDDPERTAGRPLVPPNLDIDELEHRHTILVLLDQLPPRQRQVIAWTYDGATPTEIADALQITPEAVRSNLHKARTTLQARTTLRRITGESR